MSAVSLIPGTKVFANGQRQLLRFVTDSQNPDSVHTTKKSLLEENNSTCPVLPKEFCLLCLLPMQ
jgi:hypothetical protein